jgi:hypothetical protein
MYAGCALSLVAFVLWPSLGLNNEEFPTKKTFPAKKNPAKNFAPKISRALLAGNRAACPATLRTGLASKLT